MQIVAQLEHSLSKERERLQAMMAHLHLTKDAAGNKTNNNNNGLEGGGPMPARSPRTSLGGGSKLSNILDSVRNERSQSEGPPSHHSESPQPLMDINRPKVTI